MRTETSVDNTVNDLRCKFENCVKDNNFFIKRNIVFFLEQKYFIVGDIFHGF